MQHVKGEIHGQGVGLESGHNIFYISVLCFFGGMYNIHMRRMKTVDPSYTSDMHLRGSVCLLVRHSWK